MIAIGTQAIAGIGRRTSQTGNKISCTSLKRPISSPSGTATSAASEKPIRMRRQLSSDMHQELGSWIALREAFVDVERRRYVGEAHVELDAIFRQQMPGQIRNSDQREGADQRRAQPSLVAAGSQRAARCADARRRLRAGVGDWQPDSAAERGCCTVRSDAAHVQRLLLMSQPPPTAAFSASSKPRTLPLFLAA